MARGLKPAVSGLPASSSEPRHHAHTPMMNTPLRNDTNGARPLRTLQGEAAPAPSLKGVTSATGGQLRRSCRARRPRRKATGITSTMSTSKKHQPFMVMHWNAEGVMNKKTELEHILHEKNINVCCIQETHLQCGKTFKVRGYQCFRVDRSDQQKGGVLTLVRATSMLARETSIRRVLSTR